jgi:hypothetical protein
MLINFIFFKFLVAPSHGHKQRAVIATACLFCCVSEQQGSHEYSGTLEFTQNDI